jgi:shikimate kinase
MAQDFAKQLYTSKAWIELRRNLIIERGPICQKCGKVMIDTSKLIGHHIKKITPQNINDINIILNPKNIELICHDCHNLEPHHFVGSRKHNIYLVYGAPCSGKTTLVNQMAERGDIILDIDKLFECISGMALYDKPDNLRFNVFALRDKILDMIKTRFGKWHDAYVIGTYANKQERERVAREVGAELIYCESTIEECYATMGERRLPNEWMKYIDKWFSEYTE